MRRVVVTGLGVVAPNGTGKEAFWSACLNGHSGIRHIQSFDASNHPVKIAGEVDFDVEPYMPDEQKKTVKVMGRASRFAVGAAALALRDSGIDMNIENPERVGVVMGAGMIPVEMSDIAPLLQDTLDEQGRFDPSRLNKDGNSVLFPLWVLKHLPNMASAQVSMCFNAQGPNNTVTTACVAGTQAVGEAFRLIDRGDADVMLAGGSDSRIEPLLLMAYHALGTLSRADHRVPEEVSRPYDRFRDGFVMGEGAGVLVLEEEERARQRGATIYAEVLGFGSSFDAYSLTKPHPEATGAARAIREALREAKVDAKDIDYVNAHGTSTRLNDQMETVAIKKVFGEGAQLVPLSSIKSMIGHLIGAAGAVEAAALAMTLKHNAIPPTINLTDPDPNCDLDYVPRTAREQKVKTAVSTSFGFGGQNGALVMRQYVG